MNLAGIKAGDIIKADVKGRVFHAVVAGAPDVDGLPVDPIQRGVTYRTVTAHQVTDHWRRTGAGR